MRSRFLSSTLTRLLFPSRWVLKVKPLPGLTSLVCFLTFRRFLDLYLLPRLLRAVLPLWERHVASSHDTCAVLAPLLKVPLQHLVDANAWR